MIRLTITGAKATAAAFRRLGADATKALKDANTEIADDLADDIASAARSSSRQSALVASTVRSRRGRFPTVVAGSSARVGRNRKPANKIVFGANFGATFLKQFRPHRGAGADDYWFFSTAEEQQPQIDAKWNEATSKLLDQWGRG